MEPARPLVGAIAVAGFAVAVGLFIALDRPIPRKPRSRFNDARYVPPRLVPYGGLGQESAAVCSPAVKPGRGITLCMKRHGAPGKRIASPSEVCAFLRGAQWADRESFYALHLDARSHVIGVEEVSKGKANEVEVHPREVFKSAILSNSIALLVAHNHPSGDPSPSRVDIELTRRLAEAGDLLGIPLRDHVIVSDAGCMSMRERGGTGIAFRGATYR